MQRLTRSASGDRRKWSKPLDANTASKESKVVSLDAFRARTKGRKVAGPTVPVASGYGDALRLAA